jgi:hypothetical protein
MAKKEPSSKTVSDMFDQFLVETGLDAYMNPASERTTSTDFRRQISSPRRTSDDDVVLPNHNAPVLPTGEEI